jgi:hypothetical protein
VCTHVSRKARPRCLALGPKGVCVCWCVRGDAGFAWVSASACFTAHLFVSWSVSHNQGLDPGSHLLPSDSCPWLPCFPHLNCDLPSLGPRRWLTKSSLPVPQSLQSGRGIFLPVTLGSPLPSPVALSNSSRAGAAPVS